MDGVTNFAYCNNIQNKVIDENARKIDVSALGILPDIRLNALPEKYSFIVFFTVTKHVNDKNNFVKLTMKTADGQVVASTDKLFPPQGFYDVVTNPNDGFDITLSASIDFRNVEFTKCGVYSTELYVNDKLMLSAPIQVLLIEKGE